MSNYEDYTPRAVHAFRFTDPAHERDVLKEATEQKVGAAANGQHFSAIHVNRAFDGIAPTIVRLNSLFGNTANVDQQYIAAQYAAAFPTHSYVSIDLPGHGASDKLTKEQRKAITESNGSLETLSRAQIEAVHDIVPTMRDVILTGEAMGGLLAVEFAAHAVERDIMARRLFEFDPLGMEDRSAFKLAADYFSRAQKSRMERSKVASEDGEQALEDAFSHVFVARMERFGPTKHINRLESAGLLATERAALRLMFRKSPITRATGLRALEQALETQPGLKAFLVFAGQSAVGRLTDPVTTSLDELRQSSGGRVQVDEWPFDNQDIGLARHQPRNITYVRDNLVV